ncbi:MAG: hypothetical protein ACI9LO_003419 [Planctomycetota bacterium]|jgi:hypothetical protein
MRRSERPFCQLPIPLLAGFFIFFSVQLTFHRFDKDLLQVEYEGLNPALNAQTYAGLAMGSDQLMSYLLAIRLQLHDNQAGQHFVYEKISYPVLIGWLSQISALNPQSEYPMLLASRVYSQTRDPGQLRQILEYIEKEFSANPQMHWRRMAEASVIARHQLGDLELALRMAERLADLPASVIMPHWARDLRILLLAELNQFESAIVIIEAMLQSGSVTDRDEQRFLQEKLLKFRQLLFESQQKAINQTN